MLALLPETGIGLTASSILPPETLSALWSECSATLAKNDPNFDAQGWRGSQPWTFFESVFAIQTNLFQSSTKLRKLGWAGYMDTEECFYAIFDRMTRDGFFPSGVLPGREAGRKAFKY